jgi:hypothetical protein
VRQPAVARQQESGGGRINHSPLDTLDVHDASLADVAHPIPINAATVQQTFFAAMTCSAMTGS